MVFSTEFSEKSHYAFKEVASLTGVKPYVLRFWESEFEAIRPSRDSQGLKLYSKEDKQKVQMIKELLFDKKLSIPEAKAELRLQLEKEIVTPLEENVFAHMSSLEMMKRSLGQELIKAQEETSINASTPIKQSLTVAYSEKDMIKLLQAKKKLKLVLNRIENISCKLY